MSTEHFSLKKRSGVGMGSKHTWGCAVQHSTEIYYNKISVISCQGVSNLSLLVSEMRRAFQKDMPLYARSPVKAPSPAGVQVPAERSKFKHPALMFIITDRKTELLYLSCLLLQHPLFLLHLLHQPHLSLFLLVLLLSPEA